MNTFKKFLIGAVFALVASPAYADCSQLGIGGDIGRICDDVSHTVTPVLQGGTEAMNTIGGAAVAAFFGIPPALGAQAGNCYGQTVNAVFAGQSPPQCLSQLPAQVANAMLNQARVQAPQNSGTYMPPPQMPPQQFLLQGYYPAQGGTYAPQMATQRLASVCATPQAVVPMMAPAAIGSPCVATTPYGSFQGIAQ